MCICSQTYCVKSQTWHVVYLHNVSSKDVNTWKMKSQNFNFWNVIFWMKIQNTTWFQYNKFPCCNFPSSTFIDSFMKDMFSMPRKYIFVQVTRAYNFIVIKINEWKVHIFLTIDFWIRNKNTRASNAKIEHTWELWTCSSSLYPLFYVRSHFRAPRNGHTHVSTIIWRVKKN